MPLSPRTDRSRGQGPRPVPPQGERYVFFLLSSFHWIEFIHLKLLCELCSHLLSMIQQTIYLKSSFKYRRCDHLLIFNNVLLLYKH